MGMAEQILWRELRKLKLPTRRQAPIGPFFADFACHSRKLVIEVDCGIHERIADVAARDQARTEWLESRGGASAGLTTGLDVAPAPNDAFRDIAANSPPSPTLPPSGGKGE